jgi:hypothetical protein
VETAAATAVWSHAGMPPLPIRWVLVRDPHAQCAPQALLCTDRRGEPVQLLAWLGLRWRLEVPWQEARAHLGRETPRPWPAPPRPCGAVSRVTLWAGPLAQEDTRPVRPAVWSRTPQPTVAAASAVGRQP